MVGFPITYGDVLTEEEAIQNLKNCFCFGKNSSKSFYQGIIFGIITSPSLAMADDVVRNGAIQEARVQAAKRASNAGACALIGLVCQSKAKEKIAEQAVDRGAQLAATNPYVVGAFLCGASLAWCAKYAIFDK